MEARAEPGVDELLPQMGRLVDEAGHAVEQAQLIRVERPRLGRRRPFAVRLLHRLPYTRPRRSCIGPEHAPPRRVRSLTAGRSTVIVPTVWRYSWYINASPDPVRAEGADPRRADPDGAERLSRARLPRRLPRRDRGARGVLEGCRLLQLRGEGRSLPRRLGGVHGRAHPRARRCPARRARARGQLPRGRPLDGDGRRGRASAGRRCSSSSGPTPRAAQRSGRPSPSTGSGCSPRPRA